MNNKDEKLDEILEKLYYFLKEEAFSERAGIIRKLIYYKQLDDKKSFKNAFRSAQLWGGAGSIEDIEFQNQEKQQLLDANLKSLKKYGSDYC